MPSGTFFLNVVFQFLISGKSPAEVSSSALIAFIFLMLGLEPSINAVIVFRLMLELPR